jgi:hypothetical protein
MTDRLPFPIAFSYHLIGAARDPTMRYERLVHCYEAVVRFCAAVQVSDYLAAGCPDPDLNRLLLDRLCRNLSLGQWIEITRKVADLQRRGRMSAFMPEFAEFYFEQGGGLTQGARLFDQTLCQARNEWAHRSNTWSADEYQRRFREHKGPLLDRLLAELDFLGRYTLYVPFRGPSPDVVREAFVLMGATDPPRLEIDMDLRLTVSDRNRVGFEETPILVDRDNSTRQLALCPLSVFANLDGSEDLFLFEECDLRRDAVYSILYRGFRIDQRALKIAHGSDRDRLVEQFGAWLESLRRGGSIPAIERGDQGEATSCYFAVQRETIEEHARCFVGRAAVVEALERFLAREPRGYFLIRGGPGQGKSAVACHLIKSRGWPHHLISRTGGRSDVRLILRSILAQLSTGMGWDRPLPDSVPELAKALEDLLARVAARSDRVVLILDALDELAEEAGPDPPFLVTEGLPAKVYVIVTARPGDRLDRLLEALHSTPHELYDLGPLESHEIAAILRARRPDLDDAKIALAATASRGNPLFLRAVADELERDPDYDLRDLPASIEGFFRRALGGLDDPRDPLLTDVLALLATARKPLALRELGQVTGAPQREIHQRGIRPIRQFLLDLDEGYSFYHARFHEFAVHELLYEDELPRYHAALASWLSRTECRSSDYRYLALAHHLYRAGDRDGLWTAVEPRFLHDKVRRFGYAVLEDVVLLARDALDAGDPGLVGRCIELVEGLRVVVGGDLIDEARQAIQGRQLAGSTSRHRIEAPDTPRVPGLNLYIGMLPKATVGADFVEALPRGNGLLLALGDAPGVGLKGAFVARFVGGLVRRLAGRPEAAHLGELLDEVDRTLTPHPFFDVISLQCVAVDPLAGRLAIAGAGHPHPVLYSARHGRCDRLPVGDDLLLARQRLGEPAARRRRQRHAEIHPGDVLVMVSDGLTEGRGVAADPYGYRFEPLVPDLAPRGARAIGEAILEDWSRHSHGANYVDDVTVVVLAMRGHVLAGSGPEV